MSKNGYMWAFFAALAAIVWIVSGGWCPKKCRECVDSTIKYPS